MPRRRTTRPVRKRFRALLPSPRRRRRRSPAVTPAQPGPQARGTWTRAKYRGSAGGRAYDVYLPAGHRRRSRVPLLVLLHGCRQSPREFALTSRFTAVADRHGFVILAPHQGARDHPQCCWRWYEAGHQRRAAGEPAIVAGITRTVLGEDVRWRVDPDRVFVAGLSAGGALALTLAVTYPDLFAAAGVHSAPAYRSARSGSQAFAAMAGHGRVPPPAPTPGAGPMTPTVVFQGTADPVVRPVNGDRVADQWLDYHRVAGAGGADRISRTRGFTGRASGGRTYTVVRWYTARGRKRLEYWLVDGLGHAWSGGRKGGSFSDPAGPRAATIMWTFFLTQTRRRVKR